MGSGGCALSKEFQRIGDINTQRLASLGASSKGKAERVVQSVLVQQNASDRPMLSRVAEAMYWMSRYVERAEHIARIVLINSHMLIDLGELAPDMQEKQWLGVLRILRLDQKPE